MANSIEIIIKTLYQGKGAKDAAKDLDQLGKAADNAADGVNANAKSFQVLAEGMTTIAPIIGAVTAAYGYAIAQAAEAEQANVKLNAVLRATGGAAGLSAQQLNQMAAEMSNLTGINDETITNAQALMLTFRQVGGEVFPQAMTAATDLAAVMGGDLQSATMQLGKALEDPVAGLTALRRSGVSFTKEQQDMIKALVASGKTLEAQKMILAEVEKQVGGTAAAMGDTFLASLDRLQNSVGNLAESFGEELLPSLTGAANAVSGFIDSALAGGQDMDYFSRAAELMGENLKNVPPYVRAANEEISNLAVLIRGGGLATSDLQYQMQGMADVAVESIDEIGSAFVGWKDDVWSISDAIAAGDEALEEFIKKTAFKNALEQLWASGTPTDEQIKRVEEWGVAYGIIEEGTLDVYVAIEKAKDETLNHSYATKALNDAMITATKNGKLLALAGEDAMQERKTQWTINVVGQGAVGLLGGIISGPGGGAFGAATTKRIQQGTGGSTIIGAQATGGPLQPVAMVGEQGPELIINGVVVPAGITRDLVRLGLRPGAQFATGGSLAALADSVAYNTSIQSKSSAGIAAPRITSTTNTTAKTSSPGVTYSAPSMAAESVAQGITEAANAVTSAAIQSTTSAQMMAVAQQQQTAIITESNAELINEVRLMREELARVSPDFAQAVQRIVT